MSLKAKIEAVIYASEEPVTLAQLIGLLGQEGQAELDRLNQEQSELQLDGPEASEVPEPPSAEPLPDASAAATKAEKAKAARLRLHLRGLLDTLIGEYASSDRGLEIREVAGGFRFATKPEYHDTVRGFVKSLKPPLKLTLQALETLAVVAYKQPVTAPEVSEIRGVDSGGVLGSLMTRKLVTTAGRKQVIGRPILYKTTKDFLLRFGLKDINELPSIEEFEKMAGELAEQEEIPMEHEAPKPSPDSVTGANLEEARDAVEPQADGDSSEDVTPGTLPTDGRISGPPADHESNANDVESPAPDAEVQGEVHRESEEG